MKIRIGDKIVETDDTETVEGRKVPVIKAEAEEIHYSDGRTDVVIHVPCMTVGAEGRN